MITASLRRSGGSLILTIPQPYAEQNHLEAGSKMALEIDGAQLRVMPAHARKSLAELLAATPDGLNRAEGWDEMPATGLEL